MYSKIAAVLAIATSLAAAKPIHVAKDITPVKRQSFGGGGDDFNFIDGFNNFNQQNQVIQIKEENLQIIDNGFQQQVVQQAQEVLIVNQQQNGFNNDMNNLFRKSNMKNNFNDVSTVMLVVQEIQVSIQDGNGNAFEQNIFAQSAVVANRGSFATQTVMIFSSETLIAQNVLGGGFDQNAFDQFNGQQFALPTQTNDVQLLGAKPTWSSVAEDPAATLGGIWQGELEDLQKVDNNQADNDCNNQAAAEEKKGLDEAKAAEDQAAQEGEDQAAQEGEDQAAEDQAAEDQAAADQAAADQAAADQAAQEGEDQAAQDQAAEDQAAQEGEDQAAATAAVEEQAAAETAAAMH